VVATLTALALALRGAVALTITLGPITRATITVRSRLRRRFDDL